MARSFLPRAYQEIVAMSKIIMSSDRIWTIIRFLAPVTGHRADQRRSARTIHADRPIVFHHSLVWLLHTAQVTALRSRHRLPQIDIEDHDEFPTILAQVNDDNLTLPTVLLRDGSMMIATRSSGRALITRPPPKWAAGSYRSATRPIRASGVVLAGE
jgi:hypothetical protein